MIYRHISPVGHERLVKIDMKALGAHRGTLPAAPLLRSGARTQALTAAQRLEDGESMDAGSSLPSGALE